MFVKGTVVCRDRMLDEPASLEEFRGCAMYSTIDQLYL